MKVTNEFLIEKAKQYNGMITAAKIAYVFGPNKRTVYWIWASQDDVRAFFQDKEVARRGYKTLPGWPKPGWEYSLFAKW